MLLTLCSGWLNEFTLQFISRTLFLLPPYPAFGKRLTMERSDWFAENMGLPVEQRMVKVQRQACKIILGNF